MKQTILGANGSIGKQLAKELRNYTNSIRLVSRNPKAVHADDELFAADLTDAAQVLKAVEGAEIVFVTIGFEYKLQVWQKQWPVFIKNVIDACATQKAKLVFFDNMYMYDLASIPHMTEESAINPPSEKGKVRAEVTRLITESHQSGRIEALIARSADFIGPTNSVFIETTAKALAKGKTGNWLYNDSKRHNFTIVDDAAKATALLGNTAEAYNQVWHLPSTPALTGKEWVQLAADALGAKPKYRVVSRALLQVMGWFNPTFKELDEMRYQLTNDYDFRSDKIEKAFGLKASNPADAIRAYAK
jgi:nucleoside-diphosphate-sugar epimerase